MATARQAIYYYIHSYLRLSIKRYSHFYLIMNRPWIGPGSRIVGNPTTPAAPASFIGDRQGLDAP